MSKNVRSNQLGFVLATVMAFLAASFIIMTGLSTAVMERERELAILRCVGASRRQLASTQLIGGLLIGAAGGLVGQPIGVALAAALAALFREHLSSGFHVSATGLGVGWPRGALRAARGRLPSLAGRRVSALEGLSVRARAPARTLRCSPSRACCARAEMAIVLVPKDGQVVFWGYAVRTAGHVRRVLSRQRSSS